MKVKKDDQETIMAETKQQQQQSQQEEKQQKDQEKERHVSVEKMNEDSSSSSGGGSSSSGNIFNNNDSNSNTNTTELNDKSFVEGATDIKTDIAQQEGNIKDKTTNNDNIHENVENNLNQAPSETSVVPNFTEQISEVASNSNNPNHKDDISIDKNSEKPVGLDGEVNSSSNNHVTKEGGDQQLDDNNKKEERMEENLVKKTNEMQINEGSSSQKDGEKDKQLKFRLKTINLGKINKRIVLQNENGPCPLIAIVNVLILRGAKLIGFNQHENFISNDDLVQILGNHIFEKYSKDSGKCAQVLELLPKMKNGLDVNICFNNVKNFEKNDQNSIFELLNLILLHGWIVNPEQQPEAAAILGSKSYNQVVEELTLAEELKAAERRKKQADILQSSPGNDKGIEKPLITSLDNLSNLIKSPDELANLSPQLKMQIIQESQVIEDFFRTTASQLTGYGLEKIYDALNASQLAVFFRNNHFSTIVKHSGHLYLLCTDEGFYHQPDVVWERLSDVYGDNIYCTGTFQPLTSEMAHNQANIAKQQEQREKQIQADQDYNFALQLQKQEQINQQQALQQSHPQQSSTIQHQPDTQNVTSTSAGDIKTIEREYIASHRENSKKKQSSKKVPYHNNPADRYKAQGKMTKELNEERMKRSQQHQQDHAAPQQKQRKKSDDSGCCLM